MIRKFSILATAITIACCGVSYAQLPLPLPNMEGTPEDRAACEPDVKRFCKAAIPDNMKVLSCLQANRQKISKACQGVLTRYGQ